MKLSRRKNKNGRGVLDTPNLLKIVTCLMLLPIAISTTKTASAFNFTSALSYMQAQLKTAANNDSFKTLVNQDAYGSAALAETMVIAKQKTATAEAQLLRKENLIDLYNDFIGPNAIPDSSRCFAVNEMINDGKVPEKTRNFVKADLFNTMNQNSFKNEMQRQQSLQNMKYSLSCTLEQAKQGYCTPTLSGGQYYDVDFGMSLASDRLMDTQFMAAKSGIYTIADILPNSSISEQCHGDTVCSGNIAVENNRIAVNSLVSNSLLTQLYNRMTVGKAHEN